MRKFAALIAATTLTIFAAPAHATTGTTTPDCAEHGHDADHNKHCDESTTTTTAGEETTTTTFLVELPANPTTTTTRAPFVAPTTTTMGPVIAPPHIDTPATIDAPTTTTTMLSTAVLGRHETERLPTTGIPAAFLVVCAALALAFGLALRYASRAG